RESHPSWMRGLKCKVFTYVQVVKVASFMDAWIEILIVSLLIAWKEKVASFMDAWIEIYDYCLHFVSTFVASFMDAWIEILLKLI
ncbi:hypothetical protein SB719_21230, partial [Pantoea sp. SIMBA_079]|uniref:hypothetical protein n=1 Tax=Pantoea sp. SIMBA_079 TaxID=3085817 RepID=UPI0039950DD2